MLSTFYTFTRNTQTPLEYIVFNRTIERQGADCMTKTTKEEKNKIKLYDGKVIFYKGIWSMDNQGNSYVALDDSSKDSWEFEFENIPAITVNQLTQYVLPRKIQEKHKLDFPAYIDWEEGMLELEMVGYIPTTSARFENLVQRINVREEK